MEDRDDALQKFRRYENIVMPSASEMKEESFNLFGWYQKFCRTEQGLSKFVDAPCPPQEEATQETGYLRLKC